MESETRAGVVGVIYLKTKQNKNQKKVIFLFDPSMFHDGVTGQR